MSVLLEAIARDEQRRRDWGEAVWTAPDLCRPPVVLFTSGADAPRSGDVRLLPCGFGYQTADQIGQQELDG